MEAPPVLRTILIATVSVSFASSAFAQGGRGAITGTVFDRSGVLIPGVDRLVVEHAGFTSYQQTNIRLQVAAASRVDMTLPVGQLTQSIQVTAEASMLKTESYKQSTTKAGDAIKALPINSWIGSRVIATLRWVTRPQAAGARISCRWRRWAASPRLGQQCASPIRT